MENSSKVITKDEVLDLIEKIDTKTRFIVKFDGHTLNVKFYSKYYEDLRDYNVQVRLLVHYDRDKSQELRKSDAGVDIYEIYGFHLFIGDIWISEPDEEELLFNQFKDGRKVLALFREIFQNYTALIDHP